ncbi:hypothetical protein [Phenylobacterium sp.]|uniref:hypothetical protein n=1 Tax=Phenylobacterium sp. TaxID=1871053 RepID=UPI00393A6E5B
MTKAPNKSAISVTDNTKASATPASQVETTKAAGPAGFTILTRVGVATNVAFADASASIQPKEEAAE